MGNKEEDKDFAAYVLKKRGIDPETLWNYGRFERLDVIMDWFEFSSLKKENNF